MRWILLLFSLLPAYTLATSQPNEDAHFGKIDNAYDHLAILEMTSPTDEDYTQFIHAVEPLLSYPLDDLTFHHFWEHILFFNAISGYDPRIATYLASTPHLHLPIDQPEAMAHAFLFGSFLFGLYDETLQIKWMERFVSIDATTPTGQCLAACFEKCQSESYLFNCLEKTVIKGIYSRYENMVQQAKTPLEDDVAYQFLLTTDESYVLKYQQEKERLCKELETWSLRSKEDVVQHFQKNLSALLSTPPKQYRFQPRQIEIDVERSTMRIVVCTAIDQAGVHVQTFFQPSDFDISNQLFWAIVKDDVKTFEMLFDQIPKTFRMRPQWLFFEHLGWDLMTPIVKYHAVHIFEHLKEKGFFLNDISALPCEETLQSILVSPSPDMQQTFLEQYLCFNLWAQYKMTFHFDDILHDIEENTLPMAQKERTKKCFENVKARFFPQGYNTVERDAIYALQARKRTSGFQARMRLLASDTTAHTVVDTTLKGDRWSFKKTGGKTPKLSLLCASLNAQGVLTIPETIDNIAVERCDLSILAEHEQIQHLILPPSLKRCTMSILPPHLETLTFQGPPLEKTRFYHTQEAQETLRCIFYPKTYASEWKAHLTDGNYRGCPAKVYDDSSKAFPFEPSTSLHAKTRNAKAIMDTESRIGANAQLRVLGSPRSANTPKRRDIESPQ